MPPAKSSSCHPRAGPRTYVPACAHTHTHARTHTCPHTSFLRLHPRGGLRRGEPKAASARGVVPGAAAPPALSLRTPSPASPAQTPRGRGVPQTLRPRRLPFRGEASVPLTARMSPEPRNLNRGRRGGRGGSFLTLSVAIPTGLRAAKLGWGALPFLKLFPAFPGAGALEQRLNPENSKEAHARPRAPQPARAPGPSSSRGAPCSRSGPAERRALTAVACRTPRTRGPLLPGTPAPARSPWQPPNRRSGFRL